MSKYRIRENDLDIIAKSADDNLRMLGLHPSSYGPTDRPPYTNAATKKTTSSPSTSTRKSINQTKAGTSKSSVSPSTSSRKSISPARSATIRARAPFNSGRTVIDANEFEQIIDFLLKKTKTLEDTVKTLQVSKANESDSSHNWAIHLTELIKMDKHSIADIREQVTGLKQRMDRIAQRQSRDRTKETSAQETKTDVGAISEQVFNRVHREFTQVVDEVVRSCVMEQIEALSGMGSRSRESHESERIFKSQIEDIKRKQEFYDERLRLEGGYYLSELSPLMY